MMLRNRLQLVNDLTLWLKAEQSQDIYKLTIFVMLHLEYRHAIVWLEWHGTCHT